MELEQTQKLTTELERIVMTRIEAGRLVVPSMPLIASRCLTLLRDPDFAVHRLVANLEADAVLAALVLREANAASHGTAVKALGQAVTRVGVEALRSIVMKYAAHELFQSRDRKIAAANKRIWEHSIAVALLSRELGKRAGCEDPESCYLGGLLHDVGKPVIASMMLEAERKLATGRAGWIEPSAWVGAVDHAHRRVGTAVAEHWHLPDEVTAAIRDCAAYDTSEPRAAVNVVRLSNAIAKRSGFAIGTFQPAELEAMIMTGSEMLGIPTEAIDEAAAALPARVQQALG